jgi:hypothetical protein
VTVGISLTGKEIANRVGRWALHRPVERPLLVRLSSAQSRSRQTGGTEGGHGPGTFLLLAPRLRIVDDDLWDTAQARLTESRRAYLELLQPEVVPAAVARAIEYRQPSEGNVDAEIEGLEAELATLDVQLSRLTAAVAASGDRCPGARRDR